MAAPAPAHRGRLLAILGALSAFGPLTTDVYLPALPRIARHFGTPIASVQVTLTACVLGLAFGQVLVGPLSDALGRRRPLLWGLAVFTLASAACAAAPAVVLLDLARLVQGLSGAAGIVVARAIVRDLYQGPGAARAFSTLGAIVSLGPILAPTLGAALLLVVAWPGVFVFLAAVGALLWITVLLAVPETLPAGRRRPGGLRPALRTYRELLGQRRYMAFAVPAALAFAALFAYVSASSFVYQGVFGFSAQLYGILFGVNGLAILLSNMVNAGLARSVPLERLLRRSLAANATIGIALAVTTALSAGPAVVLPLLCGLAATIGFMGANALALALEREQARAGSASALFGLLQFSAGAAVAPLVGTAGVSAVPMGVVMAAAGVSAVTVHAVLLRPQAPRRPSAGRPRRRAGRW